jgi:hypothetical protein
LLVFAVALTLYLRILPLPALLLRQSAFMDLKSVSVLYVKLLKVDVSFAVTLSSLESFTDRGGPVSGLHTTVIKQEAD